MYKNLNDEEIGYIAGFIKYYFYLPVEISKSGAIESIWSYLLNLYIRLHKIHRFEKEYEVLKDLPAYTSFVNSVIKDDID